jgi:hypothetical protein
VYFIPNKIKTYSLQIEVEMGLQHLKNHYLEETDLLKIIKVYLILEMMVS